METDQPIYKKLNLRAAPKIKDIMFCDFPKDAILPEFSKKRPVLIISRNAKFEGSSQRLIGRVTILPLTTQEQLNNRAAYKIKEKLLSKLSWIICNSLCTVAMARLEPIRGKNGRNIRLSDAEFEIVKNLMFESLPYPPQSEK